MDPLLEAQIARLKRRDRTLTPLDEARIIRQMFPAGTPIGTIRKSLKRGFYWIRARVNLLDMPEEVQQYVAARALCAGALEALMKLPERQRLEAARQFVAGKKCEPIRRQRQTLSRSKTEIGRMIERLFELGIDGLPTRLLAWAARGVTDTEMKSEILEFSKNHLGSDVLEPLDENDLSTIDSAEPEPGCKPGEAEPGNVVDGRDDSGDLHAARG